MNGHLDARLSASALKDNIKTVLGAKLGQCNLHIFFCSSKLLFGSFGLVNHRQAMDLRREPVVLGEVKAGLVDVYGDYARGAVRFCQGTC